MRSARLLAPAAILLAGALAYSSAFPGAFVFDDAFNVAGNRRLDRLSDFLPGGPGWSAQPNRAFTFATFAMDRAIAGNDPSFHRAVNLGIHLAAALLVFALAMVAFRAPRLRSSALAPEAWSVGLVAGLLFVSHPVQTQAVTYVVQRLGSLAALLYLASAALYLRWRIAREGGASGWRSWIPYAGALLATLLAMRAKEIAFTLPVALLLLELVLFDGPWKGRLLALAPFALAMALIPATLLLAAAPAGAQVNVVEPMRVQTGVSRLDYLLTQVTVVVRYLGLVVLPVGQTVDHDVALRTSVLDPAVLGSAVVLLALAGSAAGMLLATSPRRARPADPAFRLAALGIGWFFLALSVESSIIPIVDLMNEHRVYLPLAGLSLSVGSLLALGARRLAPGRAAAVTAGVALVLAAILGVAAWQRNGIWSSEVALWTDAVEKSPHKARPRHNLGVALGAQGRHAEALVLLQEAVRLDPAYAQGHDSLGIALMNGGRAAEGEAHLLRAIELDPRLAAPWFDLGTLRFESGRYAEAIPLLEQAIARHADYPAAYANLGASWNALGRPAEAVRVLQGAREVIRDSALARAQLALGLAQLGDLTAARREADAIRRLSPGIAAQVQGYIDSRGRPPR